MNSESSTPVRTVALRAMVLIGDVEEIVIDGEPCYRMTEQGEARRLGKLPPLRDALRLYYETRCRDA